MIEYIIKSITNFSSNWEKVTSTIMESQFFTDNITRMEITPWIIFSLIILILAIVIILTSESEGLLLDTLKIISLLLGWIIFFIIITLANGSIPYNYLEEDVSDWSPKCIIPSIEEKIKIDSYLSSRFENPVYGPNWKVEAPNGGPLPTLVGEHPVGFLDESARQTFDEVNRSYIELKKWILVKFNLKASGIIEYTAAERNADTGILWGKVLQVENLEQEGRIRLNNHQGPQDSLAFQFCYDYLKVHNRALQVPPKNFLNVVQECEGQLKRVTFSAAEIDTKHN